MRSRLKTPALLGLTALSTLSACALPVEDVDSRVEVREAALGGKTTKNPFAGAKWLKDRDKEGPQAVQVRFREGLTMRLKGGQPVDLTGRGLRDKGTQALLEKLKGGTWQRSFVFDANKLDDLRARIEKDAGKKAPDLNRYFTFSPPKGMALSEAQALLEDFIDVDLAYPMPTYEVAAPTEDYRYPRETPEYAYQQHLMPKDEGGLGIMSAWEHAGGEGRGVDFFDVEFAFEPSHYELSQVTGDYEGYTAEDAFPGVDEGRIDHGTATMGVVAGDFRAPGITGIAPESNPHFVGLEGLIGFPLLVQEYCAQIGNSASGCSNLESAVVYPLVSDAMSKGDVMLLELQTNGPNWAGLGSQSGMVPVEYVPAVHDAIRTLTLARMIVVEAAGNGGEDLSASVYSQSAHRPFQLVNGLVPDPHDSGAIMVGAVTAGAEWGATLLPIDPTQPLPTGFLHKFSNFGERVDIHAYGDSVVTSGYGNLWGAGIPSDEYTYSYSGTSSASAIVAGIVTSLQGAYQADALDLNPQAGHTRYLYSQGMRTLLKRTGFISNDLYTFTSDELEAIANSTNYYVPKAEGGEMPDVKAAIDLIKAEDPSCMGSLAAPAVSVLPATVLTRHGNTDRADIRIDFGDRAPINAQRGVVDLIYTTDGSEPNCVPRMGNCDLDRVQAITQNTYHLSGGVVSLDMSDGPVTLRARQVAVMGDCGTNFGSEISMTLY